MRTNVWSLTATLSVLLLCAVAAPAQDANEGRDAFSVFAIGNEYEIGAGFLYQPGDFTAFGLEARWIEDDEDDIWSASAVVLWKAVPSAQLPLGGLFPQAGLSIPQAIDIGVNLGGRIGIERNEQAEDQTAIIALLVEAELNPGRRATLAIRYEYAFDSDLWNELPEEPKQHQAFLSLRYRF